MSKTAQRKRSWHHAQEKEGRILARHIWRFAQTTRFSRLKAELRTHYTTRIQHATALACLRQMADGTYDFGARR